MMNAALYANRPSKITVPTIYCEDHIGALRKRTRLQATDAYVRTFLRDYDLSSILVGDSIDEMEKYLFECDAFKESKEGRLQF